MERMSRLTLMVAALVAGFGVLTAISTLAPGASVWLAVRRGPRTAVTPSLPIAWPSSIDLIAPADTTEEPAVVWWAWNFDNKAGVADYIAKVRVVSIGEPRADNDSGVPPTRAPGPEGSSYPSSDKNLYSMVVFDVVTEYRGFAVEDPPDGFVIREFTGSVDDFGGPEGGGDISIRRLDLSSLEVGNVGLLMVARRRDGTVITPMDRYVEEQTALLNESGRRFEDRVRITGWYRYGEDTATTIGMYHDSPTVVVELSILETELQDWLPTVTPTMTLTPTATLTPTPTPATFPPSADAYTLSTSPTQNYGTASVLNVRGSSSPYYRSYLKFDVSGISGTVMSAILRLWVSDTSVDYGQPGSVSNSWTETGLTWNNQPSTPMNFLTVSGPENGYVTIDVTSEITGNGTFSFGIQSLSTDLAAFGSREDSNPEHRPLLTIVTQ